MAVKGPVAKTSLFSGESGSVPCLSLSQRIFAAKPLPPRKFNAKASSYRSGKGFFLVKSKFRKIPVHPNMSIARSHVFKMEAENKNLLKERKGLGLTRFRLAQSLL